MALTPENDTGLANADSYVSVAEYKAWATARGYETVTDATDDECEPPLRIAFDFINTNWLYKSSPVSNNQAGEFPRVDLSDGMGRIFNVVPQRIKNAQMEAAYLAQGGVDLFVTAERGGQVASEAVGPISTSYFQGASPDTYFQSVERAVMPFVKDKDCPRRPVPSFNDYGTDPIFSVGMDDNPGQA